MSGFELHKADCVILLFRGWTLDSPAAFALGVIGTFTLGILTEWLTWARRRILATSPRLRRRPRAYRAAMGGAFTVQVTLGYFLMLAAMTYQGELFLAVVLGLGAGHLLFNVTQPVGESTDACCVEAVTHSAARADSVSNSGVEMGRRTSDAPAAVANCPSCVPEIEPEMRTEKGAAQI